MKKEDVKGLLEIAWFAIVINVLVYDFGYNLNLWDIKQNVYPFLYMPTFFFGLYPVITMWIFKLSYRSFWKYLALNALADVIFAYVFLPWLVRRGLHSHINYFAVLLLALAQAIIIYLYRRLIHGKSAT